MGHIKMGDELDLDNCVEEVDLAAAQRQEHIDQAKEVKENMEDLKEMSQNLNQQVVADDDKIKDIESNIDDAEVSIDTGNDHLVGAVEAKKKKNAVVCWTVVGATVCLGIIAIVIYFSICGTGGCKSD